MQLDSFIHFIQYEKRFSPHTILAYRNDLKQFLDFLTDTAGVENMAEVRHTQVRSWVVDLLMRDYAPRTIHRKLSTLKTYFHFLRKRGVLDHNPVRKVAAPKTGKRLPTYLQASEVTRLFEHIEFGPEYAGQRDRLLLELLYATGIRRSELLSLTVDSFNWERQLLRVSGKGGKERLIPIDASLRASVEAFISLRGEEFPDSSYEPLLLTDAGKPLYPKAVYNIVHRYLSLVSTVEKRSPHVLRHSFATHLSDNGADLNAIKALLGHANLAATQVYTHNSIEKLKRVYEQAHPKAKTKDD